MCSPYYPVNVLYPVMLLSLRRSIEELTKIPENPEEATKNGQ